MCVRIWMCGVGWNECKHTHSRKREASTIEAKVHEHSTQRGKNWKRKQYNQANVYIHTCIWCKVNYNTQFFVIFSHFCSVYLLFFSLSLSSKLFVCSCGRTADRWFICHFVKAITFGFLLRLNSLLMCWWPVRGTFIQKRMKRGRKTYKTKCERCWETERERSKRQKLNLNIQNW